MELTASLAAIEQHATQARTSNENPYPAGCKARGYWLAYFLVALRARHSVTLEVAG